MEHSFAWLLFGRRLDHEYYLPPEIAEAFVMIAFVRLMIHQIVRVDIEKKIAKTLLGIYDKFPNSL